ncbi:Transposase [Yarrowia sp. B02]|nr:Transposase [Yarrowia sp. B02]
MEGSDEFIFFNNSVAKLNTEKLLTKWFNDVFLPQTTPKNDKGEEAKEQPRMLIWDDVDPHSSYGPLLGPLTENKVNVVTIPREICHFTSPVEFHLAPKIKKSLNKLYKTTTGETYSHKFVKMIREARQEALTEENMEHAWEDCGLWPVDHTKVYYLNQERVPKKIKRMVFTRR